jgi:hypothetical protein
MRSCRASTTANGIPTVLAGCAGPADAIGNQPSPAPGSFHAALSVAEQIVVAGLAEMWADRQGAGAPDRRALLASLTNRANVLTLRAAIEGRRSGGARAAIRGLAAGTVRAAGRASESAAGAA